MPQPGCLVNNSISISPSSGVWKSEVEVLVPPGSGEDLLLLADCRVLVLTGQGKAELALFPSSHNAIREAS